MAVSTNAQWVQCCYYACLFLLLAGFIASSCNGQGSTSWWSIGLTGCGRSDLTEDCPNCAALHSLEIFSQSQSQICSDDQTVLASLANGARDAILDCQDRFNASLWNCSTLFGDYLFGRFTVDSPGHTKETAVLTAYFAAAAITTIAEDCHNQRLVNCPCLVTEEDIVLLSSDDPTDKVFRLCRADFGYASTYYDDFVVSQVDTSTDEGLIDDHNTQIGKELVNGLIKSCRCHGVSGTCSSQTCYLRTPTIDEVGETLFQRYSGAARVRIEDTTGQLVNAATHGDPHTNETLVFKNTGPNFCNRNDEIGILGTAHRRCDPNSGAVNSCNILCCNRGYYPKTRVEPVEKCKFHFCCEIRCNIIGNETITEYFCNPPPTPNGRR